LWKRPIRERIKALHTLLAVEMFLRSPHSPLDQLCSFAVWVRIVHACDVRRRTNSDPPSEASQNLLKRKGRNCGASYNSANHFNRRTQLRLYVSFRVVKIPRRHYFEGTDRENCIPMGITHGGEAAEKCRSPTGAPGGQCPK